MRKRIAQALVAVLTLLATWIALHFAAGLLLDVEAVSKWLEESASLRFIRADLRRALIEQAWKPLLALAVTVLLATRTQLFQSSADFLLVRAARRVAEGELINVPGHPPSFLPRKTDLARLKATVLGGLERQHGDREPSRITGVSGMAGTGKSVLAAALVRDRDVRRAFPDGVLWVTIGQDPDLVLRQSQIAEALGDAPVRFDDWQKGRSRLSKLLGTRACLLVLDDVWSTGAVTAFDALGPRCRMLITTRDSGLIRAIGAAGHELGVLGDEEAMKLLAGWTGRDVNALPAEAHEVARECGNLPLALAMIGAMVGGRPDRWANALHKLRSADLQAVRQEFPGYPYPDLLKAIDVSVNALEQEEGADRLKYKQRYLDLAVYPEDTPIPEAALQSYWRPAGLDEPDAQDVLDRLVSLSLLRTDDGRRVSLHDLHRDYVRANVRRMPVAHGAQISARLTGHRGSIMTVALLADGRTAVSGAVDGTLRHWDVERGTTVRTVGVSAPGVWLTHLVTNGRHAVSASRDGTARLWDAESGAELSTVRGKTVFSDDENDYGPIKLTPDGRFAVWLAQHTLKDVNSTPTTVALNVWDLAGDAFTMRHFSQSREGWSRYDDISLSPDSRYAVTPSRGGELEIWELESGERRRTIGQHSGPVAATAITPGGRSVVSLAAADGTPSGLRSSGSFLCVWDMASGEKLHALAASSWISTLAFTNDGRFMIGGSVQGGLQVWDLKSGASVHSVAAHSREITLVRVTSSGLVVSASEDGTLNVWDPEGWRTVASFGGDGPVRDCAASPDGATLVVGTGSGQVDVLRLAGAGCG